MLKVTECWWVILLTNVHWGNFLRSISLTACSCNTVSHVTVTNLHWHWGPLSPRRDKISTWASLQDPLLPHCNGKSGKRWREIERHLILQFNPKGPVLLFDHRVIQEVDFVLHQNSGNVSDFHLHFLPPAADGLERLSVRGGEDEYTGLGTYEAQGTPKKYI